MSRVNPNLAAALRLLPQERPVKPLRCRVRASAVRRLKGGTPWVFDRTIDEAPDNGRAGDLVAIYDQRRQPLGLGLWDPDSPLRVRRVSEQGGSPIDGDYFLQRIAGAMARREGLLAPTCTTGYRWVNGESDGMPAWILDRYGDTAVLKLYSTVWMPFLAELLPTLQELLPVARVVLRLARKVQAAYGRFALSDGLVILGDEADISAAPFLEDGALLEAQVIKGQKTGFFLDQRENRARVRAAASGRRVLDLFSFSGGFSLAAARGGAMEVFSVDGDGNALQQAARHFAMNRDDVAVAACEHHCVRQDVFAALADFEARGERFDLVVVDPPSFAANATSVEHALSAYAHLAQAAAKVLRGDGRMLFCSCSAHITESAFMEALRRGLGLHWVSGGGPYGLPADHPASFPEAHYLKAVWMQAGS